MSDPKRALEIAITMDWTPDRGHFLKTDCVERFRQLGVHLRLLLHETPARLNEILKQVDGLVLPGGVDDVDPVRYGQMKRHERVRINDRRTNFEFQVLEQAFATQIPTLAICWGHQMLNVFLGGSLHQHLPEDKPSQVCHEQEDECHKPTHWVQLQKDGVLHKIYGTERCYVNSTHHQAVANLGRGLTAEGTAEDGILEAYSGLDFDKHYVLGVQWHPERLAEDPIIPAFLNACRTRR